MIKTFTETEAWNYIIINTNTITKRIYYKNISYNKEDILQDTILLLFKKLTNKKFKLDKEGNVLNFNTIINNCIVDVLRTKYKSASREYPCDFCDFLNISNDFEWK